MSGKKDLVLDAVIPKSAEYELRDHFQEVDETWSHDYAQMLPHEFILHAFKARHNFCSFHSS